VAVVVAEGEVVVTADATGIPRAIADDIDRNQAPMEQSGQSMGRSIFGGVVGAWAAIGGTQAVVGWFAGAVSGASDLNETMSAGRQIFGDSAGIIEDWASTAATSVGLSRGAAAEAAINFGNMFKQLGWTADAAAALSTQTVQVAADLGSFRNLETADVSERISAAFRGEYDSLQLLIPNINAARVEQEALAATGKASASELTAQEKAAAVLAIVQKDGADAMGDFARTSDGAANSAKIVTASLEDQQAKLGSVLLPIWSGFLGLMNDSIIPAFSDVVDWVGQNTDTVLMLGGVIAGTATALGVYNAVMLVSRAYQAAAAATTGGLTIAQWALNAAMSANPIGIIIVLIGALVAAIVWVATQTTFFQDAWANVTSFIGTAWQWLWDTVLNPVFTAIGAVFTWLYETIILPIITGIGIYIGIWAAIFTWLYDTVIGPVFAMIGAAFDWIYNTIIVPIVGFIQAYIQGLGVVFSWLWETIINPVFQAVAGAFGWIWDTVISPVVGFISSAITTVGDTVRNVFEGIPQFFRNAFEQALSVVRGPVNGIIAMINNAIDSLNTLSVTIPEWVPAVGGQTWGLDLPHIPYLARGTLSAPDAFIAGENGPELVMGARGARVFNAGTTAGMVDKMRGETHVHLTQNITSSDPILASRQAAREVTRYLNVAAA
jgi:hypothetical protein